MPYSQRIENCFEDKIGKNGIAQGDFAANITEAIAVATSIKQQTADANFAILNNLQEDEYLAEIISTVNSLKENFDELVVLGTGGSTLNPQAICALAQPHEGIDKKVYFIENVDFDTIEKYIAQFDLENTAFLVTSKSGKTVETLSQFMVFISEYEKAGVEFVGKHFYIISDPKGSPIRKIGEQIGATVLDHEPKIGGRFSTFTNVGLIPAAFLGLNVQKLRDGAIAAMGEFIEQEKSVPVIGAALAYSFMQKGTKINVMMPYVDRLAATATWYRQIWAESLGKNGKGSTPIKAIGPLDQHSQLQLYLDGPNDKFITVITLNSGGKGSKIDAEFKNIKGLDHLHNKTIGDINAALQEATISTLVNNGCPVRHIYLENLDEFSLGRLLLDMILETVITAGLLDINAFDQPAVEEGKNLARELLGGK